MTGRVRREGRGDLILAGPASALQELGGHLEVPEEETEAASPDGTVAVGWKQRVSLWPLKVPKRGLRNH